MCVSLPDQQAQAVRQEPRRSAIASHTPAWSPAPHSSTPRGPSQAARHSRLGLGRRGPCGPGGPAGAAAAAGHAHRRRRRVAGSGEPHLVRRLWRAGQPRRQAGEPRQRGGQRFRRGVGGHAVRRRHDAQLRAGCWQQNQDVHAPSRHCARRLPVHAGLWRAVHAAAAAHLCAGALSAAHLLAPTWRAGAPRRSLGNVLLGPAGDVLADGVRRHLRLLPASRVRQVSSLAGACGGLAAGAHVCSRAPAGDAAVAVGAASGRVL